MLGEEVLAIKIAPPGRRLVYLADGMCTPSWVSFSPLFSNAKYQKKTIFLEPIVTVARSIFIGRVVISSFCRIFYTFRDILFADFSKASYHLVAKFLKPGENNFLECIPP